MTLVIVPAFNEVASVGDVVRRIRALGLDALVVDDGSTDGTAGAARSAGARVVRLPVNVGVGGALRTGFRRARQLGYTRVVQVDADLQHDPAEIPRLLAAADQGHDLVVGSRFTQPGYRVSWPRRSAMHLLSRAVSARVGTRLDDVTSGFRVISEPLLAVFAEHYPAEYLSDTVEALLLAGDHAARIAQVPVRMEPRAAGRATPALAAAGHFLRILLVIVVRPRRRLTP